jgi:hypothetical protein
MTVKERSRRHLQEALVHSIGPDPTDTPMGYLPPTGWTDVATKDDLNRFATELRAEFRVGLAVLRSELHRGLRIQLYWIAGLVVTLVAAQMAATAALFASR